MATPKATKTTTKKTAVSTELPESKPKGKPGRKPAAAKVAATAPATPAPATTGAIATKKASTKVVACVDVGFGNHLYIRGDAKDLDWKKGMKMSCAPDGSSWIITFDNLSAPVEIKFLINDKIWNDGENLVAMPATENIFNPVFKR